MATIGMWFACERSEHSFGDTHKARLLETGCNRIITSDHESGGVNSEKEVAEWAAGDASRPRMIPGQTRADDGCLLYLAHTRTGTEAQKAEQSYNHILSAINGVEGFLVYHESKDEKKNSGLPPVMDKLNDLFHADRGTDPELYAVHVFRSIPGCDDFFNTFWPYSNAVF